MARVKKKIITGIGPSLVSVGIEINPDDFPAFMALPKELIPMHKDFIYDSETKEFKESESGRVIWTYTPPAETTDI